MKQSLTLSILTLFLISFSNVTFSFSYRDSIRIEQLKGQNIDSFDLLVKVTERRAFDTLILVGAKVQLEDISTGEIEICFTNEAGMCFFKLKPNTDYEVYATMETNDEMVKYLKELIRFTTKNKVPPASIMQNFELNRLLIHRHIKVESIYFDFDQWSIRPDAALELEKIVRLMNNNPNMRIEINSNADCRLSEKQSMEISEKRAQSCLKWLFEHGIDSSRFEAYSYGETHLVNDCACEGKVKSKCSDVEHQKNNRIEFKFLKIE